MLAQLTKLSAQNLNFQKSYLEKDQWQNLASHTHLSEKEFMFAALGFAQSFSQTPTSHYPVGAIAVGESGRLYFGANIEFPGTPLFESIHAEQCAVSHAYAHRETSITDLYLTAFPCGHCRQFLREMGNYQSFRIHVRTEPRKIFSLTDLLPHSFGAQDLGVDKSLFVDSVVCPVLYFEETPVQWTPVVEQKACFALSRSFAPYSKSPAACVIVLNDGTTVDGSYLESCAYNPSLSAFHMAYAQCVLQKVDMFNIKEIYFMELRGAAICQGPGVRLLIESILPGVPFYAIQAIS